MASTQGACIFSPMAAALILRWLKRRMACVAKVLFVLVGAGWASAAPTSPTVKINIGDGDWRCELLAEATTLARTTDPLGPFDALEFPASRHQIEEPVWVPLDPMQNIDLIKRAVIWHEAFGARAVGKYDAQDARLTKLRENFEQTDVEILDEVWSEIGDQFDQLIAADQFHLERAIWQPDAGGGRSVVFYRYTMFSNVASFPEFRFATQAQIMGQKDAKYWNLYVSEFDSRGAWEDLRGKTSEISGLLRLDGDTYYTVMRGEGVALGTAQVASWPGGHQAVSILDYICAIGTK